MVTKEMLEHLVQVVANYEDKPREVFLGFEQYVRCQELGYIDEKGMFTSKYWEAVREYLTTGTVK